MSPEQLRAEPLDGRADLFALGVVLFEALGGRRPYDGAHDPATIMLTLSGDHPSLRGLAPGAPPGLCDAIESLLRPDRDDRPPSASALIDLLDDFVPSPRARRDLGKMVAEYSATREKHRVRDAAAMAAGAAATDQAVEEDGAGVHGTDASNAVVGTTNLGSRGRSAKYGRSRALAGAFLLIGLAIAGGLALWPKDRGERNEAAPTIRVTEERTQETDVEENAQSPRPDDPEENAGAHPAGEHAGAAVPAAVERRSARLTVIVFPWGNIWINGKPRGPAPLKNEPLKPGRYEVSVGQQGPFKTRTVRLRAGQRKTLDFDLTK